MIDSPKSDCCVKNMCTQFRWSGGCFDLLHTSLLWNYGIHFPAVESLVGQVLLAEFLSE